MDIDDVRQQVKGTLRAYKAAGIKWILSGWYKSAVRSGGEVAKGTRFHISGIRPERVLDLPVLTPPERDVPVPVVHSVIRDQAPPQEGRPAAPQADAVGQEQGRAAAPPAEAAAEERGPQPSTSDGRRGRPQAATTAPQVVPLSIAAALGRRGGM